MNQDVKDQWLTALRSGDYEQGTRSGLHSRDNKFCCLGVLCDLAVKAGVLPKAVQVGGNQNYEYRDTDPKRLNNGQPSLNGGYAPYEVMRWAGLSDCNPPMTVPDGKQTVPDGKRTDTLALLNDSGNYDFAQLANLIEAQL